jgi:TolB protein
VQRQPGSGDRPGSQGLVAFSTGFVLPPDPDLSVDAQVYTVRADGSHERQLTHVSGDGVGAGDPAFSPDGARIAYVSNATGRMSVWMMDADGRHQHQVLTAPSTEFFQPAWSPDGARLAVVACDTSLGFTAWCDIDTVDVDGARLRQLVGGHHHHAWPQWSPDGRTVSFVSDRAGLISAVWLVGVGSRHLTRLTQPDLEGGTADWSPNGRHLVVSSNAERPTGDLYRIRADGGRPLQLTHFAATGHTAAFGSYSPDGRRIVFASDVNRPAGTGADLFTMRLDGTDVRPLVTDQPDVVLSDWGPDPQTGAAAATSAR